jgi:hypothetical protein
LFREFINIRNKSSFKNGFPTARSTTQTSPDKSVQVMKKGSLKKAFELPPLFKERGTGGGEVKKGAKERVGFQPASENFGKTRKHSRSHWIS